MRESIARATATAGGAVVFAGITVAIALCSLVVAGIPLVTTLGYTAAIAVVVASLPRPRSCRRSSACSASGSTRCACKLGGTHPDDPSPTAGRGWRARFGRRPWPALIGSVVLLLVLAAPVLQLRLGQAVRRAERDAGARRRSGSHTTRSRPGSGRGRTGRS